MRWLVDSASWTDDWRGRQWFSAAFESWRGGGAGRRGQAGGRWGVLDALLQVAPAAALTSEAIAKAHELVS